MNEQDARRTILEMIQQRLEAHRQAIEEDPELGRDLGSLLELDTADFEQFGNVLGWSTVATSSLYTRLVREGFIRQKDGDTRVMEVGGVIQYAWVEDLTDAGFRAIGVLHDPAEALAQALSAAMQDVEVSEDIPEDKKPDVVQALDRVLTVARLVEGAAQIISRHLPPSGT